MSINPEVKQKWLDALRSGKYGQTSCMLNDGKGGYCCLGVLSDIYAKENELEWKPNRTSYRQGLILGIDDTWPDPFVLDWSDFPTSSEVHGVKDRNGNAVFLTSLNDEKALNFNQIADLIEVFL